MPAGALDFDAWVAGLKDGRSYVGDGKSHLLDFTVGDVPVGEETATGEISQLNLEKPSTVTITARVAARLDETPNHEIKNRSLDQQPYWDVERARIAESQKVPVELIVNGQAVETQEIVADGEIVTLQFEIPIDRSSWVALRIFPSSHTNPVFVVVDGKPVRASRRSATMVFRRCGGLLEPKGQPHPRGRTRCCSQSIQRSITDISKDS